MSRTAVITGGRSGLGESAAVRLGADVNDTAAVHVAADHRIGPIELAPSGVLVNAIAPAVGAVHDIGGRATY
ncbi:hypothetical protein ACTMSW_28975 [Micromonospora sp. BQ11]|uniref:hypothetical protein n=1 Tax=Micromonospora sp. BQ11 TaxID=3452212 RepID=UPI003F88C430